MIVSKRTPVNRRSVLWCGHGESKELCALAHRCAHAPRTLGGIPRNSGSAAPEGSRLMSATAIEDLKLALDPEILRIRWQKVIGTVWSPKSSGQ